MLRVTATLTASILKRSFVGDLLIEVPQARGDLRLYCIDSNIRSMPLRSGKEIEMHLPLGKLLNEET